MFWGFFCPTKDAILSTRDDASPGDTNCSMSVDNCTFFRQNVPSGGNKIASSRDVLKIASFVGQKKSHNIWSVGSKFGVQRTEVC